MGTPRNPDPVRLFVAVMYAPTVDPTETVRLLEQRYGPIGLRTGPIPFTFTEYYTPEMGAGLRKDYLVFERPFDRGDLPDVKLATNAIEAASAVDGCRRANLDPGYLSRDKLALASTKDFYHRLYLGKGIFAEVTLYYREGAFRELPWTYADYRIPEVHAVLQRARAQLVGELRREMRET